MKCETDVRVLNFHPGMARLAAWGVVAGVVVVPLLFGVAMEAFPAGHQGAPAGYSFSRHVVSDLGRTAISNGVRNTLSCAFFGAAMTVTALICALFWGVRSCFLSHSAARRVALYSGLVMSALMAAIGFTPLNISARIHDPITAATAIAAGLAVLAVSADRRDRLECVRLKYLWLGWMLLVSGLWTVLIALHHERLLPFRPWLPLCQKLLIATFMGWMVYQASLLFRVRVCSVKAVR